MLVIIKSAPDTTEGARGLTLAKEGGADLVLLQNGVYFAQKERLGAFAGAVYVLDDDKRLRGLKDSEMDARARSIDYDKLTDIITGGDKVVGMF
jgi:sulfur relay protein TusB/DsrH